MSKLPKVFSDASVQDKKVIIGVYSEDLQIIYKHTIYNKRMSVEVAEELALLAAIKITNGKNCHFFVDNMQVANRYRGVAHWVPREFNRQADALTKLSGTSIGAISITSYIQTNYTVQQKIKLICALLGLSKKATIGSLANNAMACRLMQGLLKREEKPKGCKKSIDKAKPLTQKEFIHLINTYRNGSIAKY